MGVMNRLACLLAAAPLWAQSYRVVDVQNVPATGDFRAAIVNVNAPANPVEITCDILVAGAGAGGVAASLRALQRGHTVCLTEETDVIGGQFHSVPALDEHKFIEISGATRSYYELRERIRAYYRSKYRLAPSAEGLENFNPGACYVSSLCFEPKVAIDALTRHVETLREESAAAASDTSDRHTEIRRANYIGARVSV